MDNQKDNRTKPLKDSADTDVVLSDDSSFAYIAKKLEKLATAIHLITNFFPKREPLRMSLRENVLSLLSVVYKYKKDIKNQSIDTVALNLKSELKETLSLLEIAQMSGYCSEMNFTVLKREIQNLSDILLDQASNTPTPRLAEDFFDTDGSAAPNSIGWAPDTADTNKHQNTDTTVDASDTASAVPTDTEDNTDDTSQESPKKRRQRTIVGLFEDTEEITISDVEEVIDGYSSKTLQRDLSSLVQKGILEKHGKRRWTSYKLANDTQ